MPKFNLVISIISLGLAHKNFKILLLMFGSRLFQSLIIGGERGMFGTNLGSLSEFLVKYVVFGEGIY